MTSTPLSSILLVFFGSLIGSIGMVFLKKASSHLHHGFLHIFNWNSVLGVGLFLLSSVFYLKGIAHGQLSVLYPMVSLSYVWALIWAKIFFHERFTREKFMGLGLVIAGVCCVGFGS
jgi:drug/metabolite transporter (DMT)-like permease